MTIKRNKQPRILVTTQRDWLRAFWRVCTTRQTGQSRDVVLASTARRAGAKPAETRERAVEHLRDGRTRYASPMGTMRWPLS